MVTRKRIGYQMRIRMVLGGFGWQRGYGLRFVGVGWKDTRDRLIC